ncbi:MAG: hypothetical protein E4H14_19775 [Candidatus Thorarchaeota archaeon]|nr:MAG: hypothetical protein E4H14_19775 [Candidatus Thorarchaeota archaeon]
MFWTIVTVALFGGGILLYAYARWGGFYGRFHGNVGERMTSSDKLRMSKMHDAAFFDGESEDYAEHMSRLRQYGGA